MFVMASIFARQNANGTIAYRLQVRRKGIPYLNLSFGSLEEAEEWAIKNEKDYIDNPEKYLKWIEKERLILRREREFK